MKFGLQTGENNLEINVKAENGVERTYFIKVVKKLEDENLKLSSLKLTAVDEKKGKQEVNLNKQFAPNTFVYSCEVYNEVTKIEIDAVSNKENTKIEVQGNENLKEGQNTIKITLKDDEGNETIYKIQVEKKPVMQASTSPKEEKSKPTIALVAIVLLVIVLLLIVNKNKKSKHSKRH